MTYLETICHDSDQVEDSDQSPPSKPHPLILHFPAILDNSMDNRRKATRPKGSVEGSTPHLRLDIGKSWSEGGVGAEEGEEGGDAPVHVAKAVIADEAVVDEGDVVAVHED